MPRSAGIREARLNLSGLLEDVRKGREVIITDRGRPVARLVPATVESSKAITSRRRFRRTIRLKGGTLAATIEHDRADRF